MKISELIYSIKIQDLVLPEFQREYVWTRDQAKKLMSSLVKDYPVGSLLFWKTNNPPELKNYHGNSANNSVHQVILDGQQRLTTLYLLITGEIPPYYTINDISTDPRNLYYHLGTGDFQYYQAVLMQNDPLWVEVVNCFSSTSNIKIFNLVANAPDEEKLDLASAYLERLTALTNIRNKELPDLQIPSAASIEDAIDIFDLVNSQGTKLTDAELALTHVVGKWPQARRVIKEKIEVLKKREFDFSLSFMTRALTTVVSHRALYETIHVETKPKLMAGWDKLSKILDYLVTLLPASAYVNSTADMSTTNVLIPIIAYLSQHNGKFPNELNLNRAIHFMYSALTWSRYSGQTDQRLESDVSVVFKENNPWDKLIDALIDQRGRIKVTPNDLEGRTAGHPLYYMTYILAKANGAIDWFNGAPLNSKQTGAYNIHSHHIFPTSYLYAHGYDADNHLHRKIVNEIANRAYLTADTNLAISNMAPEEYLPEIETKYPGALAKQFIPMQPELWKVERFPEFLEARRLLIATKYNDYLQSLMSKSVKVKGKSISEIIELGESNNLEFKSTLQWDIVQNRKNKSLRKSVLKTIAAFLNSEGGTLLIGVEDNLHVCGIENDLILTENSPDKFMNLLATLISDYIGVEYADLVKIDIEQVQEKNICRIEVDRSLIPAYLTFEGQKEFFIRMANTSRSLDLEETVKYINAHWA